MRSEAELIAWLITVILPLSLGEDVGGSCDVICGEAEEASPEVTEREGEFYRVDNHKPRLKELKLTYTYIIKEHT